MNSTIITKRDARKVFKRNYGAAATLARELEILPSTVSLWMRGKVQSKRIEDAVISRAAELLAAEQSQGASQ